MKVVNYKEAKVEDVGEGSSGVKIRWLITKDDGAPNFAMRLFEVQPGGYSPLHSHPWEHEVFILEGEGCVLDRGEEREFKAGDVVFVLPEERHQFRNSGKAKLKFLCLVPHKQK